MKTALIQHAIQNSQQETIAKTVSLIEKAAKQGAQLVVLQELHQDRYFCINEDVDCFDLANNWEADIAFWSGIAKENKVVLVTSLFE